MRQSHCERCGAAALREKQLQGPVVIGAAVILLAAATVGFNGAPMAGAALLLIGSGLFGAALYVLARHTPVRVVRIDDERIWLRGAHPDALPAVEAVSIRST